MFSVILLLFTLACKGIKVMEEYVRNEFVYPMYLMSSFLCLLEMIDIQSTTRFFQRLYLACLHYNENAGRDQRIKRDDTLQWSVSFPRGRDGNYVLKRVLKQPTYGRLHFLIHVKDSVYPSVCLSVIVKLGHSCHSWLKQPV